jgi:hypothetical protein
MSWLLVLVPQATERHSSTPLNLVLLLVHLARRNGQSVQSDIGRELINHILDVEVLRASATESCERIAKRRLQLMKISSKDVRAGW